jgi:hypothetical protein
MFRQGRFHCLFYKAANMSLLGVTAKVGASVRKRAGSD